MILKLVKIEDRNSNIISQYLSGKSVPKIAKERTVGRTAIYKILVKNNIKIRNNRDYLPKSSGKEKEIIAMYNSGCSASDTGKIFEICESTVFYVLRKNNVGVRKCGTMDWSKHPNWKGGLSRTNKYMAAKNRKYRAERKKIDPLYRATCAIRTRISSFFRRGKLGKTGKIRKCKSTIEMLGANFDTVLKHIESQFQSGMTWENYGQKGWHVDHKIPLCSARNEEDLIKLMHWKNLQPLWAIDNHKKGGKYVS